MTMCYNCTWGKNYEKALKITKLMTQISSSKYLVDEIRFINFASFKTFLVSFQRK